MLAALWRLTRGYRLRPWKSPYLRWRMETYWGMHADRITFGEFWRFAWAQRRDLLRYLRWTGKMERQGKPGIAAAKDLDNR
jgi:hypothetical protein